MNKKKKNYFLQKSTLIIHSERKIKNKNQYVNAKSNWIIHINKKHIFL